MSETRVKNSFSSSRYGSGTVSVKVSVYGFEAVNDMTRKPKYPRRLVAPFNVK